MLITVEGRHGIELPAERATLHLDLQRTDQDRARALREVERRGSSLVAEIRRLAEVEGHVVEAPRTWTEQRFDAQGEPVDVQHHASLSLQVVFRDATALSECTARWGEEPDVQLGHVTWELTATTRRRHEDEVTTAAVADARRRAAVMARAAGGGEPRLVELADPGLLGEGARQDRAVAGYARMAKAEAIELSPAPIVVSAVVHARFEA